jgi:hypothetical protein
MTVTLQAVTSGKPDLYNYITILVDGEVAYRVFERRHASLELVTATVGDDSPARPHSMWGDAALLRHAERRGRKTTKRYDHRHRPYYVYPGLYSKGQMEILIQEIADIVSELKELF